MLQRYLLPSLVALAVVIVACRGGGEDQAQTNTAPSAVTAVSSENQTPPSVASSPVAAAQAMAKLNLNTATREQFLTIPGVGDNMVREFMEYRPYISILQYRREIGKYVPQSQVAEWEKYLYVPVDPNRADAETLQQLPGVDASIAAQLIAGRPYVSSEAFLTKLGQYVSAEQVATARLYLLTP